MRRIQRGLVWGVLWCSVVSAQSATSVVKPGSSPAEPVATSAALPAVALEVQAVRRELLPADGLWLKDGAALSETGNTTLESLATLWGREFLRVDRVRVVGHVQDPQSQSERATSLQRAQLVQHVLMAKGGRQWRFQTEVLPVNVSTLSGCSGVALAKLAEDCPVFSRVVAIEVLGVRR